MHHRSMLATWAFFDDVACQCGIYIFIYDPHVYFPFENRPSLLSLFHAPFTAAAKGGVAPGVAS